MVLNATLLGINMRRHGVFLSKEGMTRIWEEEKKKFVPVTVLKLLDQEAVSVDERRAILFVKDVRSKINKPMEGIWKKHNISVGKRGFFKSVKGEAMGDSFFEAGRFVDVTGKSKGKGFQGVMKRWNFKGGRASHGASLSHRSGGSTGMRQDPGKTTKGKKMAGHMGHEQVTQQNLRVVRIADQDGYKLLLLEGSVPGPRKSLVFVREAVKKYGE